MMCYEKSKKWLANLCLSIFSVVPAVSNAQSSVTLFGTMDDGIEYLTNANKTSHSVVQSGPAEIYSNSFGLMGSEGLGGDVKAIFRLEGGFNPYNGASIQGGRLFGRQAWVGIQNSNNRIIFGRVYTPLYDVIGYLDPLQGSNVSLWTMDGGMVSRMDNAVRYTRSDGPFHENVQYSLGSASVESTINGPAGSGSRSKEFAASADYTAGQLMAGIVYDNIHGPMTLAQYGLGLFVPSAVPAASSGTPQRAERIAAALRYKWDGTSLFAGYRHLRTVAQAGNENSNLYWGGVTEQFTPAWTGTVGAYHQRVAGVDAWPTMVALQTQYRLSKSTGVYGNVGKVWNTRLSNMGLDLQTQTLQGAGQFGASIGIFHFF